MEGRHPLNHVLEEDSEALLLNEKRPLWIERAFEREA